LIIFYYLITNCELEFNGGDMKKLDFLGIIAVIIGVLQLTVAIISKSNITIKIDEINNIINFLNKNFIGVVLIILLLVILWLIFRKGIRHKTEDKLHEPSRDIERSTEDLPQSKEGIIQYTTKKVALFLPRSKRTGYFWDKFEYYIREFLEERGFECVTAHTDKEYSSPIQKQRLEKFPWKEKKVNRAIVAPAGPEVFVCVEDVIMDHKISVVLHDTTHEDIKRYFTRIPTPLHVNIDNFEGGKQAAQIMYEQLTKKNISLPYQIIIIPGKANNSHSKKRIDGFESKFKEKAKHVSTHLTGDGNWNRKNCKKMFRTYLDIDFLELIKLYNLEKIHGLFACNDEMAIAADKVINDVIRENHPCHTKLTDTIIVGFDATDEMMEKIEDSNSRIEGTIDAKIPEQAEKVVDLLTIYLDNQEKRDELMAMKLEDREAFLTIKPEPIKK